MNNVRNSKKKLVVLSAPSGAGKSSLLNNVISQHHDIGLTISHTTRDIRPNEKNNIDYYFISKEKFQAMINEEEFIEFAEVHGNFYGTTKKEIDEKNLFYPDLSRCTDNGAMIAFAASEKLNFQHFYIQPLENKDVFKTLGQ